MRSRATATGAEPSDLAFVTVRHAEFPGTALYVVTSSRRRSLAVGDLRGEFDGFDAASFRSRRRRGLSANDRTRESDRERIRPAVDW